MVQYHYITNYNQTNANNPQNIDLLDLATAESTSFLITYQDENYLPVKDAVVDLWRKYVDQGTFLSVEHAKTDTTGSTRLHFNTEDIIYKFYIWKNGTLDYVSDEYLTLCQATPCQINLRKQSNTTGYSNYNNIVYSWDLTNTSSRTIGAEYSTTDGSTSTAVMTVTLLDNYMNQTVCNETLISSGGSLTCTIPETYDNSTYLVSLYSNGEFISQRDFSISLSPFQTWGYTGVILTVLLILTLALMVISSLTMIPIFVVIGFVIAGLLTIFDTGSFFGLGSAITWLIVAVVIIVWKLNQREGQ